MMAARWPDIFLRWPTSAAPHTQVHMLRPRVAKKKLQATVDCALQIKISNIALSASHNKVQDSPDNTSFSFPYEKASYFAQKKCVPLSAGDVEIFSDTRCNSSK